MAGRYIDLVSHLAAFAEKDAKEEGKERKWLGLIDDDTFFPCLSCLLSELETHFSPEKPHYIGALTERVDWLLSDGRAMAYGGAGIFLTLPLAQEISTLPCLETEFIQTEENGGWEERYKLDDTQGDGLLYNCIKQFASKDIVLNELKGLRQMDQWGDQAGFYESGGGEETTTSMLSLHHYRSWHHFRPEVAGTVARVCGGECVFQRFRFGEMTRAGIGLGAVGSGSGSDVDGGIGKGRIDEVGKRDRDRKEGERETGKAEYILTNGYSLTLYPHGIDFDTNIMEGTFDNRIEDAKKGEDVSLTYSFGPLRPSLSGTGRKRSWGIVGSRREVWGLDGEEVVEGEQEEQEEQEGGGGIVVVKERGEVRMGGDDGDGRDGGVGNEDGIGVRGAGVAGGGGAREVVRQVYLRRKDDERWYAPGEERLERDSVVVVVWVS